MNKRWESNVKVGISAQKCDLRKSEEALCGGDIQNWGFLPEKRKEKGKVGKTAPPPQKRLDEKKVGKNDQNSQ